VATGKTSEANLPSLEYLTPLLPITSNKQKKKSKQVVVHDVDSSSEEDTVTNPVAKPHNQPLDAPSKAGFKCMRESKNKVIKSGIKSLTGAIGEASEKSAKVLDVLSGLVTGISASRSQPIAPAQPSVEQSHSDKALGTCTDMFLGKVDDDSYVCFITVLEDETKARTFLWIACKANRNICRIRLEKEIKNQHAI
jgi:hypothetical protein